jgi:hypothetical protein
MRGSIAPPLKKPCVGATMVSCLSLRSRSEGRGRRNGIDTSYQPCLNLLDHNGLCYDHVLIAPRSILWDEEWAMVMPAAGPVVPPRCYCARS